MILNSQRQPDFSLYYLGGVLLKILEQVKVISIEKLLEESQQHLKKKVHVDFIYYGLDWLYLLELVRVEEGKVYYENKKINSTQNRNLLKKLYVRFNLKKKG